MKRFHTPLFEGEGGEGQGNGGGGTMMSRADSGSSSPAPSPAASGGGDNEGSPSSFDFRTILDDKGGFKQGWEASLPEDLKPSAGALTKYPNPLELMRGHANAAKLIGQKSAPLKAPAPDAKPEEMEAFNKQIRGVLGVPEKVEDYKLEKPASLPEGLTWDDAKAADFSKLAHSLNIPPAAAAKLIEWQAKDMAGSFQKGQAKLKEWEASQKTELEKAWGADMAANMGRAAQFAKVAGFDLDDPELGNNAKFITAMFTASKLIKQDALVGTDKASTAMDGAAQAEDIRRNPNNPWYAAYQGKEGPERQKEAAGVMRRLQGVKE